MEGVRILDFSRVLAGPIATMVLGDLGAEVIKVEPPAGDETRSWAPLVDGESAYFMSINRNKRSIIINLKTEAGREVARRLIEGSDVIIENFRPGVADSLGIGYSKAREIRPDIIYCSIRGFGSRSPYSGRPAYDLILQAMSGLMMCTGEEGRPPVRVAFALFDIIAGLIAANSILAALIERGRTGRGRRIEVSLYDSAIFGMSYIAMIYLMTGRIPPRMGSAHPSIVPYQAFKCGDGRYIAVAATNERFWSRLCKALGLEELIDDPRFKTNVDRVRNRNALIPILEEVFLRRDRDEWVELLRKAGVPCGPVYELNEVFNDPHTAASGVLGSVKHPTLGRVTQLLFPALIDGKRPQPSLPPPIKGQHSSEILKELGYSDVEIEHLLKSGAVCCK